MYIDEKIRIRNARIASYQKYNYFMVNMNYDNQEVIFNLPKSLNIKELESKIYKFHEIKDYSQKRKDEFFESTLLFISNLLSCHIRSNRTYVNLSYKILAKFIKTDYITKIERFLENEDILMSSKTYKVGIMSRLFKYDRHYPDELYNNPEHVDTYTIRNSKLVRKIVRSCEFLNEFEDINSKKIKENMEQVDFDLNKFKNSNLSKNKDLIQKITNTVKKLNNKNSLWFKKDIKTGRMYNEIANFPSKAREFLKINNEEVGELDIKNCQPMTLAIFYTKTKGIEAEEEKKKYLKIIFEDDLYEFLNSRLKKPLKGRKNIKQNIYKKIFYGGAKYFKGELWKIFRNEFPILAGIVKAKKNIFTSREFALMMQKIESRVVIGTVFDYFRKYFPNITMIPIHDGIMMPKRVMGFVKKIFADIFYSKTGIYPVLVAK